MKKYGFTLAEVLITLAIIGVVATLTLPALMTNTAEQQYMTGLKKGINTISEAGQMSESLAGFNFSSIADASAGKGSCAEGTQSIYCLFEKRAKIDDMKSGDANKAPVSKLYTQDGDIKQDGNFVIFFQDGTALSYNPKANETTKAYNLDALFDVNGAKGPNLISNCSKKLTARTVGDSGASDDDACTNKDNRVIRDQFPVRLEGSSVAPSTSVGRWVMGN